MKIKQGDTVEVIAGKDKGKRGTVTRVFPGRQRVQIEGVNIVKRHTKPRPTTNARDANKKEQTGGVIDKEAPIHVSNVMLVSPGNDKPTRVGYKRLDDGRKVRVTKTDGVEVDR